MPKTSSAALTAEALVAHFDLQPHPEGGFFLESFRAKELLPAKALPKGYGGPRAVSTAIYFLLPQGSKSRLHRLRSDELWHFYLGGPLTLFQLSPEGRAETVTLGQDIRAGQKLQHLVPAGTWFGAEPGGAFSFMGCTVAPGFDFADFEMGSREELERLFPAHKELIKRLS